jgi:hypothetical protein
LNEWLDDPENARRAFEAGAQHQAAHYTHPFVWAVRNRRLGKGNLHNKPAPPPIRQAEIEQRLAEPRAKICSPGDGPSEAAQTRRKQP